MRFNCLIAFFCIYGKNCFINILQSNKLTKKTTFGGYYRFTITKCLEGNKN